MSSRARLRKRDNFDPGQLQVLGPEVEIRLSSSSAQLEAEVCYDFKSNQYQTLPAGDFLINLLTLPSRVIHREDLELQTLARETAQGQAMMQPQQVQYMPHYQQQQQDSQQHEPQDVSHELEELYGSIMSAEQLAKLDSQPNPFNFSERVSQTLRIPRKTVGQQTDQPPSSTFGASVGLSVIYDAYQHDYVLVLARERLRQADKDKDDDREKKSGKKSSWVTPHTAAAASTTPPHTDSAEEGGGLGRILRPTRIMERMVNQNIYDDIIHERLSLLFPTSSYVQLTSIRCYIQDTSTGSTKRFDQEAKRTQEPPYSTHPPRRLVVNQQTTDSSLPAPDW